MGVAFTIAIPTHNRRETVLMAVRSVLAQRRPAASVLVLCDGCSDGTAAAVRGLGAPTVEAVELEKGPGYAYAHRNVALERAETEAVAWVADDDLLLPDHLERIGALWDAGGVDLVQNAAVRIDPDDTLTWMGADWSLPALRERFERENTTPMSSVTVRAALAREVGGWDGTVARAGDWDLWRRMLAAGARSAMSPEPTHLHFRATGRDQPWADRVRQNARWLARVEDPGELPALRRELHRAREQRDAERLAVRDAWEQRALGAERHGDAMVAERDAARAALAATEQAHAAAEVRLADAAARAEAAERESVLLGDKLASIEQGGWWRLRARLLPLLRAAGRSR
jgi:GT2 family glycosyltransferase